MRRWPINSPIVGPGVIAVRVQALGQLFDSLDPSPSREKDVSPKVEEYIVDSAHELSAKAPVALVVYIEQAQDLPGAEAPIEDAIRGHFARRARLLQRKLRRLLRRGVVSLAIGLTFMVAVLAIRTFVGQMMGERSLTALIRESLLIVVWVAMWRPLEIFLYDWWPIAGERRLHDRLSRIPVRIVLGSAERGEPGPTRGLVPSA